MQSFDSPSNITPQQNIADVFARARKTSPCVLVLEELDSLLTPATRAFSPNELDGFADNEGSAIDDSASPAGSWCRSRFQHELSSGPPRNRHEPRALSEGCGGGDRRA